MKQHCEKIHEYLESEMARGSFPGAQYLIGERSEIAAEGAIGYSVIEPERIQASLDTIYDMASLTKPLVTTLLLVKFFERGLLDFNAPVTDYLSEFEGEAGINDGRPITLKRLMTHTSGLPNWRPLYLEAAARSDVLAALARIAVESQDCREPAQLVYSDLCYVTLGFVLERIAGERLDRIARREIFDPLELKRTMFNPPPELKPQIAATERGQEFEQKNTLDELGKKGEAEASLRYRWREGVIWGEVHDGNAHFMDGVSGHAGLFSTAREVFQIARQFFEGSRLLRPESIKLFTENITPGFDTARSVGWILASTRDCSAGPTLPPTIIGHNGFTGTSVWMDPPRHRVFILLTNRVHPKVTPVDMKTIRQQFNTLAFRWLDEK